MFVKSLHFFTNISGQPDWALFEHLLIKHFELNDFTPLQLFNI